MRLTTLFWRQRCAGLEKVRRRHAAAAGGGDAVGAGGGGFGGKNAFQCVWYLMMQAQRNLHSDQQPQQTKNRRSQHTTTTHDNVNDSTRLRQKKAPMKKNVASSSSSLPVSNGGHSDPLRSLMEKAKEKVIPPATKREPPPQMQRQKNSNEFEMNDVKTQKLTHEMEELIIEDLNKRKKMMEAASTSLRALELASLKDVHEDNMVILTATATQGSIEIESACVIVDENDDGADDVSGADDDRKEVFIPKEVKEAEYHRAFKAQPAKDLSPVASGKKGGAILHAAFHAWPEAYREHVSSHIDSLFPGTKSIFNVAEYGRASLYKFDLDDSGCIKGTGSLMRNVTADVLNKVQNELYDGVAVISSFVPLCLQQLVSEGGSLCRNHSNYAPYAGSTARGLEASCRVFFDMIGGIGGTGNASMKKRTLYFATSNIFADVSNVRIAENEPSKDRLPAETHYEWRGTGKFGNLSGSQMQFVLRKIFMNLESITNAVRAVEPSFMFTVDTAKGSSALYNAVVNNTSSGISVERFIEALPMHGTGPHPTCLTQEVCMALFAARLDALCTYYVPRQSIVANHDEIRGMINQGRDKVTIDYKRNKVKAGSEKQTASTVAPAATPATMQSSASSVSVSFIPATIIDRGIGNAGTEKQTASTVAPVATPATMQSSASSFPLVPSIPDKFVIMALDYKFECEVKGCNKRYLSSGHLNAHRIAKHINREEWKFECNWEDGCKWRFATQAKLNEHILIHHEKKIRHYCEACGDGFAKKSHYDDHFDAKHLKLRPFVCNFVYDKGKPCNHSSTQKSALKTHMLSHVTNPEMKRFECSRCGFRTHLKHHLEAHIGRKFPCKLRNANQPR